ncbi:MAG: CinA family protein [Prevotella sp.]|jgi:nicotinamide-nucleotide amidase|nr:CinA family protein [Prevotella sp.]MCI2079563.1 CinA family protein [Prevotella sp.]MCI2101594.1 CinA family protein [Prevotella sp.]HCN54034.1 CinA family protein [Prevotella sp.]
MEFETKTLSRQIQDLLYDNGKTLGTAESCTGGRIAEAIIAVPGASNYFKGGIISYTNEIKMKLLHVNEKTLEEQTAVCEDVAKQMVSGACDALNVDYAISSTGIAGPGGGTKDIPVGTIWIGFGAKDDVESYLLTEDDGRDINLAKATNQALKLFLDYIKRHQTEK